MRRAAFLLLLALAGCGEGARQLLETAEFEELQKNTAHARVLYERIVREHPGTPEAATAAARLQALPATPPP